MKRIITYCFVALLGLIFTGCPIQEDMSSRSFIEGYYKIDGINFDVLSYENEIWISGTKNGKYWEYCSAYVQKEKYDALCRKHNDMNWNREPYSHWALDTDFSSILVVSDADFDETHPAGTSLADVLNFNSGSAYPFIMSGYAGSDFTNAYFANNIKKPLSDVTSYDMVMLGRGIIGSVTSQLESSTIAYLSWLSEPTLSKTHNITVTLTADDGRVFSDTVQVSWE